MGKRRTEKRSRPHSAASKPSRQERRQATRNEAKAQQTVETTSSLTAATSYSRSDALALVALGLLVVVCYLPAMLWGGFVWDDSILTDAKPVQDVSGLWQIWFSPSAIEGEGHYWPLVYTTFWVEHKLWGFDPTGYHIVNVLLHLANTLLVWYLVRRLAVPGAWVVAAVFAVHPLHVESVAWVIERKDVLSGLFYLASVLVWMRFVEQSRRGWYVCSLALYAAGLLSKSIVITLPVALLLWHWWQQGRVTATDLLRLVPFGVVGLAITVGDLLFYWSGEAVPIAYFDYSLTERVLIAAHALWFYAGKLLWPSELAVIYPLWDVRVADPLAWGYVIAAAALALTLWCFRHRIGRGPLAGVLFFVVTLSPVLGFVDYGYMQFAFVADRFQYLAGIGVMAVVIGAATYGVRRLPDWWQKGAWVVAAMMIVVLGLLTWRQAGIWRDDETLNRHIIALNPQARSAHYNLSLELRNQGRLEEAIAMAQIAVEKRLDHGQALFHLGVCLYNAEQYEEAEAWIVRAIELIKEDSTVFENPDKAALHWVALVRAGKQRYGEALAIYQRLIEADSTDVAAYVSMSTLLYSQGRLKEALQHLDRVLAIEPSMEKAQINRKAVLEALKGKVP